MADGRFYATGQTYTCPTCRMALTWEAQNHYGSDRFLLVHGDGDCPHAGKRFYAPGHDLTEFKEESGG